MVGLAFRQEGSACGFIAKFVFFHALLLLAMEVTHQLAMEGLTFCQPHLVMFMELIVVRIDTLLAFCQLLSQHILLAPELGK